MVSKSRLKKRVSKKHVQMGDQLPSLQVCNKKRLHI